MKRKKILVVDNHPIILEYMSKFLSKDGHEVLTSEDGLHALDILETWRPDIIFVDLIMPNIDGKKLCQIIRAMPEMKDTYLIILSAAAAAWVACGHVHEQALYYTVGGSRPLPFKPIPGVAIPVPDRRRWLAIVGSAGQPRDGNTAACYAMLDTERPHADFGCLDGVHTAWIFVEAANAEEAKAVVPPAFRSRARAVALNKWSLEQIDELVRQHQQ